MNKNLKLLILVLSILIFIFILVLRITDQTLELGPDELLCLEKVKVSFVYDGDTIRTANGERVRLLGVDAPEINWETGEADFFADQAFTYTKGQLLGKEVYLEYDQLPQDKYGRKLAYLYLQDGTFFNYRLLKEGYASLFLLPPNLKYADLFKEAAREARLSLRGIWTIWDILPELLPVVSWQEAPQYLNQEVIVKGRIENIHSGETAVFLNFVPEGVEDFYLVIFQNGLYKLDYDPVEHLMGKRVMAYGLVKEYQGMAEIIIERPYQLLVLSN